MDPLLVPATWRRLAVLLLTWISAGTTLRRSLLTVLTWWGWLLAVALWRSTIALRGLLTRWSTVTLWWLLAIALGRLLAIALRWLLTVALRRRAILTRWCTVASGRWVGLLVLGIVASVNSTKKKLDDPKIRCEIDRWVGTHHLFLFVFKV
jgi:hypothetical protein